MSQFCTSCGAPNSGAAFCTSCGASFAPGGSLTAPSTATQPNLTSPNVAPSSSITSVPSQKRSKKRAVVLSLMCFILIVGGSVGGFFAGKASIDLKKERTVAYDAGYEQGNSNGYSSGIDAGYSDGYKKGCNYVFDKIGLDLIAIAYPWYDRDIYGYRWNKYDVC